MKIYPITRNGEEIGSFLSLKEARAACYALAWEARGIEFGWGAGSVKVGERPDA